MVKVRGRYWKLGISAQVWISFLNCGVARAGTHTDCKLSCFSVSCKKNHREPSLEEVSRKGKMLLQSAQAAKKTKE